VKKEYFTEVFQNLTRYKFKKNFIGSSHTHAQNNYNKEAQICCENIKTFCRNSLCLRFLCNYFDSPELFSDLYLANS